VSRSSRRRWRDSWAIFLDLPREYTLKFRVSQGGTVAIVAFVLATCCIGLLVLAIPFVGTLVLLPFIVTYRYLSLEFLAQFDPSLDVFGSATPAAG